MNDFMQQNNHLSNLLSKFLSDKLTFEEKGDLYHYIIDDSHKDEIMAWLQTRWEKEPVESSKISSDCMFSKIKIEIEKYSSLNSQQTSGQKIQINQHSRTFRPTRLIKRKNFLRYAAIFIIAFGLSWMLQKKMTTPITQSDVIAETILQYNEILVPYGSKTKVILPDSSTVWLNAGARLRYPAHFDDLSRNVFLQGEGFFEVTKDSKNPFIVNSNGLNIKVLGTKFNLKANADDNFIETTLVEGVIEILEMKDNANRKNNLVLKPGQKLTVHKGNDYFMVQNIQEAGLLIPEEDSKSVKIKSAELSENTDMTFVTAWTENKLVFVKERFDDVKTKLERWYGVTINVNDPELLDYRFTGFFEKQTFEQAMNALSKAASCKYKIDKNHVMVYK